MANQTLSLREEAYEKLQDARMNPSESLSDVVMRAQWDHEEGTGGGLFNLPRKGARSHDFDEFRTTTESEPKDRLPSDVIDALVLAVARMGT
jgi:hypothetical protein